MIMYKVKNEDCLEFLNKVSNDIYSDNVLKSDDGKKIVYISWSELPEYFKDYLKDKTSNLYLGELVYPYFNSTLDKDTDKLDKNLSIRDASCVRLNDSKYLNLYFYAKVYYKEESECYTFDSIKILSRRAFILIYKNGEESEVLENLSTELSNSLNRIGRK